MLGLVGRSVALALAASSVLGIRYNATLDPWNINKNQGECSENIRGFMAMKAEKSRIETMGPVGYRADLDRCD